MDEVTGFPNFPVGAATAAGGQDAQGATRGNSSWSPLDGAAAAPLPVT